ncbi:cell division protein FtsP [Pectobacterium sp. B1J-3]|uniref:cell division protein FtsP n=1 Tax=Pectobacterium sp. B1J-3 TaxID=3385371 RepID=UPI0039063588
MSLSRRQFIQASGLALCAGMTPAMAKVKETPGALPIPPLLESRRGQPLFLTMQRTHWAFAGDRKTSVWGINGRYLGPTVRVFDGDDVKLIYSNRLNEPVAMTIGGLQVPGSLMGGAARIISPGMDWSPVLPIRQPSATCWYHANTPNRMAPHIYNGLVGLWLVEDSINKSLPLPNHYGVDDFPLIIQDKRLDNFGVPIYSPPANGGFVGDTLLVNGVQNPFVEVSRGWVRLRLLNASNARRYVIRLSDGRPMHVIASDQGLLPAPMAINQISLAPGERREILVNMSEGGEVTLTAGESAGIMDRLRGLFEPSSILISTQILTLKPTGLLPLVTDNLPMRLLADNIIEGSISRTREFRLGDSLPGINGAMWDMTRMDVQTQFGRCERWVIHADTPQSFHIQGVKFLVRSMNGGAVPVEDSGWKDTVWVDNDVELLVYFMQPSSSAFPFLYYSQTLEMADRGSAGQLIVQPSI